MHGVVFTAFRTFSERKYPAAREEVWAAAPRYLATAAYPDEEFVTLVASVARLAGEEPDRVLRRFGIYAGTSTFRLLYPGYYAQHSDTLSFLLDVEERIHETVRRTIPDARPPYLGVTRVDDSTVLIAYTSPRRLCALLEGLVLGIARYYGETVRIEQTTCMNRGDPAGCAFVVSR